MRAAKQGVDASVDAFVAGEGEGLAAIYGRWSPLVYTLALGALGGVSDAEAVTQQVFTRAWRSRQAFDAARGPLSSWLVGIAQEEIATSRSRAAESSSSSGLVGSELTDPDGDVVRQVVLADEMSHLDDVARQILQLALFDHLTHEQIADRLHLPADEVRNHLHHSLTMLRDPAEVTTDAR